MGTFQDRDGYKSHSDPSTSFKEQWQAQEYDQKLNQAPYLGYKPDDQPNSDDITFLNDDSYDDVQHKHAPYVKIEGDTAIDIWLKPFTPLWAYWLLAFPAINSSWLLRTADFPFSWIGFCLYYPWTLLVKVVGAPYYFAYLFGDAGVAFAMPIIAVIWFGVLCYACNRLWHTKPQVLNKVLRALAIAAVVPVVLAVLAYVFGFLDDRVVENFMLGHDPYTYMIKRFFNYPSPGYGLPSE
jgi:hypothetical protein